MQILIATHKVSLARDKNTHPHLFTDEHLKRIQSAAGRDAKIIATSDPEKIGHYVEEADIIAGFPMTLPSLRGAKNLKWLHSFSAGVE